MPTYFPLAICNLAFCIQRRRRQRSPDDSDDADAEIEDLASARLKVLRDDANPFPGTLSAFAKVACLTGGKINKSLIGEGHIVDPL